MRKFLGLLITFVTLIVCGISGSVGAALVDSGGGMIYDTDRDITWLQDMNYAKEK